MKISCTEKKTNQEVIEIANTERSLIKTVQKRQMRFMGHVYRKSGLEQISLIGKIVVRKSRGWQQKTYIDSLNIWAT